MNRILQYTLALFIVVLIASCGHNSQDALKLNNTIVAINDSLFDKGKVWGEEFKISYNTGSFSALYPLRLDMQQFVERNVDMVKSMRDVGGSEELRKAEIDFLQFEQEAIKTMSGFESFNETTDSLLIEQSVSALLLVSKTEQEKIDALKDLQYKYAKANDFELTKND